LLDYVIASRFVHSFFKIYNPAIPSGLKISINSIFVIARSPEGDDTVLALGASEQSSFSQVRLLRANPGRIPGQASIALAMTEIAY